MEFTICTSIYKGNAKNKFYPNKVEIDNPFDFEEVVSYDHTCAVFKKSQRNIDNFISSNVVVMDCDNDHTNNASEWVTIELLEAYFPDINYVVVPSKSNNRPKGELSPRPRFHVYFPIDEITNAVTYANIKRDIQRQYPFFDANATDAARFIFGNKAECVWHTGNCNITNYLVNENTADEITEGSRNSTLSHFAGKVIKRFGDNEKAYELFLQKASKCTPPLDDEELSTIWRSAQNFGKKIAKQDGYVPPERYNDDFDIDGVTYKPTDYTDLGQATVLAEIYKDRLSYSPSTDFLVYNGAYWEESKTKARKIAQELTDLQMKEAEGQLLTNIKQMKDNGLFDVMSTVSKKKFESLLDDEQKDIYKQFEYANDYRNYVLKRRNSNFITSTLKEASVLVEIDQKQLDTDEFLLNTPKGTYDLRSSIMKPPTPLDFITKQTSVSPSDKGKDIWEDALDTFFCGDIELQDYVQQIVGLAAIGKVYVEAIIIAYGVGKNGKSTFWNTIAKVLGSYSGNMSADALTTSCKRNIKPEMAELRGKRLVIASETEDGQRLSTSSIKQLCSTDEVYAEKKYKDPFSFTPSHSLVLYTNHLPKVSENDKGTWRRLIVIPFEAEISSNKDVKNYADYLYDNAGESALQWIIEGAKKVIDNDFKIVKPKKVVDAISAYREQNDWLKHFIDDCCDIDKSFTEKSGDLFQEYRNYCARTGEYARSTSSFYKALEDAGYERKRVSKGRFVAGIKLKNDFE